MNAPTSRMEVHAMRTSRQRTADLLARYPKVSNDETREILEFMRTARHLEIGLLTADDALRPNFDTFMEDHKKHFGVKPGEAAMVVGLIAAFLLVCWLFWEILGQSPA
jgi:hypothetical protein